MTVYSYICIGLVLCNIIVLTGMHLVLNKHNIRFRLTRNGSILYFRVFKMNEKFRFNGQNNKFISSNGMIIKSDKYHPLITKDIVYLRGGDRKQDDYLAVYECETSEDAQNLKDKIIEAIEEWSDSMNENGIKDFYTM